jgi:ATP:ADP antiporter, AAA family
MLRNEALLSSPRTRGLQPERTRLDRTLAIFADVRAGEGAGALLLAANVFCLLTFYSVLKIVREALILSEGGAEIKSYAAAAQTLLLIGLVPAYAVVAARVNRTRLNCGVTLFFASHLLIFYLLGMAGIRVGIAFFLWIGIFNLVVIAQFWSFANDLYDTEAGKRLFPLVGVGASLGAVVGAAATAVTFTGVGAYRLMLIAAAGLLVPIGLTLWTDIRDRDALPATTRHRQERPLARTSGFRLIFTERYLLLIACLIVMVNVVNTLGEFLLGKLIAAEATAAVVNGTAGGASVRDLIGTMSGYVQTSVNVLGLLIQAFLVSRVFKWIGVRGALFILPLIALGTYSMIAVLPILSIVRAAKVLENSTDYSIQNTARHALFLPTSREAKYNAKQAIDAFFWRAGDLLQAGIVFAGVALGFSIRAYATVNLVLVVGWLAIVVALTAAHRHLAVPEATTEAAA